MKISTTFPKIFKNLLVLLFWVGVWYLAALVIDKELFLPYPHSVAVRFTELAATSDFWLTVLASLFRILRGFIYGIVLGVGLAFTTHYLPVARAIFSPFLRTIRAVPVASFTLLLFLWLDNDIIPVFIALLMVTPIIWENLSAGLGALNNELTEMARVFKLPKTKTLNKIIMPQLLPYLRSGALTGLGLAWKSGIAAEVISYPSVAIGKALNDAKITLETVDMLVWTVVVVVLSLVFEGLIRFLFKKGGKKI